MVLYNGIQRFLDEVDPVILSRGQNYFHWGHVESIDYEDGHVTAEVSGSEDEPYLVDIDFDEDGEVEAWNCDCPYDWGPVCKHTVAALLAVRETGMEHFPPKPAGESAPVEDLVRQAKEEQLVALILEHCSEDRRFRTQVLSELEESGKYELASIKSLVKDSVRANTHRGYIDEDGCGNICADLDDALDKARRRIGRGQYDRALDIAEFVLLTGMGLLESDSSCLEWTIDAALETIGLAAKAFAESGAPREEWVQRILKTAQDPLFDDWEEWRLDFLGKTAVLADAENENEFERVLLHLSAKRWESFKDAPKYIEQDCFVRYQIVCAVCGQAAGRAFLEKNVAMDKFRLMLVQEYVEEGNYARAEQLCRERIEREEAKLWRASNQWDNLLYEVYRDWGQREKQTGQARKLVLQGEMGFYQITKDLLLADGQWQKEYPQFLAELKAALPAGKYMEILSQEGEAALLMEQVRVYRNAVFQYGGVLAAQYGKEIHTMCEAAIRQVAKHRLNSRKDYQTVCGLLRQLVGFGGSAEAQSIITELRQAYPRRTALWEELEQVEREIGKRQKS